MLVLLRLNDTVLVDATSHYANMSMQNVHPVNQSHRQMLCIRHDYFVVRRVLVCAHLLLVFFRYM